MDTNVITTFTAAYYSYRVSNKRWFVIPIFLNSGLRSSILGCLGLPDCRSVSKKTAKKWPKTLNRGIWIQICPHVWVNPQNHLKLMSSSNPACSHGLSHGAMPPPPQSFNVIKEIGPYIVSQMGASHIFEYMYMKAARSKVAKNRSTNQYHFVVMHAICWCPPVDG